MADADIAEGIFNDSSPSEETRFRIEHWANAFRWRLDNDYDAVVVFTGPEGSGKSTLSYLLANILDPSFNATMRTGFGTQDVIDISKNLKPKKIVEMDEGVEGLLNRDAMRKENKLWQKWMIVCRQRNLGVFICFPRFESLDLYMREHRVWTWVRVLRRGLAEIRVRNWQISAEHALYEAFPVVARMSYPSVEKASEIFPQISVEDWERKQDKKWDYVQSLGEA